MFGIESNVYIATHILSQASVPLKVLLYSSLAFSNVWLLRIAWIFSPPFCISDNFTTNNSNNNSNGSHSIRAIDHAPR